MSNPESIIERMKELQGWDCKCHKLRGASLSLPAGTTCDACEEKIEIFPEIAEAFLIMWECLGECEKPNCPEDAMFCVCCDRYRIISNKARQKVLSLKGE